VEMSVTSTDFIKSDVEAITAALNAVVSQRAAFLTDNGSPVEDDWIDAELVDGVLRAYVGPGGHPLPLGTYLMWGELVAPPITYRAAAGLVTITH
jgi:hypothetical protein